MRNSSAKQQEFDFSDTASSSSGREHNGIEGEAVGNIGEKPYTSTANISFPSFGISSDLYASAARRAGRLNAANISDNEFDSLLLERQLLLDKELDQTITRAESIRLQYVRWQLDRIEDARHGEALDALEDWVTQYERFQADLESLQIQLSKHRKGSRK